MADNSKREGFPPAPLPGNDSPVVNVALVDASPESSRSVVIGSNLGDGYKKRYHLTNPGDATAFNALCRDKRLFWSGLHIENAAQLLEQIALGGGGGGESPSYTHTVTVGKNPSQEFYGYASGINAADGDYGEIDPTTIGGDTISLLYSDQGNNRIFLAIAANVAQTAFTSFRMQRDGGGLSDAYVAADADTFLAWNGTHTRWLWTKLDALDIWETESVERGVIWS